MSENIIKASELRIGNLVIDIETGKEYVIKPIDIYNAAISVKPLFAGIKLTEEKLVKAGFEKYDDCGELKGNDCSYGIKKTGIVIGLIPRFNLSGYRPAKRIEYVHRLQNLYSDLTGEELPIY